MKTRIALVFLLAVASLMPAVSRSETTLDTVLTHFDQDAHSDLKGVVVLRDGHIVAERYYNGETPDALHDIRSAGKSITSLLVGIAIDRKAIHGIDDPVSLYWPEAKSRPVGEVPLRDILTMRSGLAAFDEDPASPGNEDRMDDAADPLAFVLSVPRADPPGLRYRYNSVTAYTAGVVVAKATGRSLESFASTALFAPLGITRWHWASDASGYTKGQGNLLLTTRDLAKIGEMVREGGVYEGRRIVSEAWLADALSPKVTISDTDPYANGYGYFWYAKNQQIDGQPVTVSFASGNGGNKIYIVPSRHLVVAITSSAYGKGYGQKRSEAILKAILTQPNSTWIQVAK
ncbi:serine hydrolase [Asticcacaulis sp. 201]|uniref:serine hydrolase domain-containing protein n=1 Tax=Asticcacaulis sp. 201 TaxID=3028787 RepID=UPI002916375C|nr:serine hydrolase [Asticcacaulis sp. 201]MDV6330966.1 serine hydrolase [Asticcacaulis sp. 201]